LEKYIGTDDWQCRHMPGMSY